MRRELLIKAVIVPIAALGYLGLVHETMGLRPEHLVLVAFVLVCFYAHPRSRDWIITFLPFVMIGVSYDLLRVTPLAWRGPIQILAPYQMESLFLGWFGLPAGSSATRFFQEHNWLAVDLLTGFAYSVHIILPAVFAFWLWLKKSPYVKRFTWAILAMNVAAFATYLLYPSAPPWYVDRFGFENMGWEVTGYAAGLLRVDAWLGIPYFAETYARGPWIYGAIPSMHAAYPLLISLFARLTLGNARWIFYGMTALICFAAVYLNHHYVIDLVIGWGYAIAAYLAFVSIPECVRSRKLGSEATAEASIESAG